MTSNRTKKAKATRRKSLKQQYRKFFKPVSDEEWASVGTLAQPSLLEHVDSIGTPNTFFDPTLAQEAFPEDAKLV